MKRDLRDWVTSSEQCQHSKIHHHTKPLIHDLPQPTRHSVHIYVDVVEPHPPSKGMRYIFTIIDCSTRWPEATPRSCILALLSSWIAHFRVPEHMTSDRRASFTSELWKALKQLLGVALHYTLHNSITFTD
ncbi:uncharacterized protein [Penaeus vannamei]|uniref:uncharacterized protein n=1 Tax=Penaeus vannamei TaxID=6689 RepID=UPI00387FAC3C